MQNTFEAALAIATDARDSDRMSDALRILVTEGNLCLQDALDALTPNRKPQVGDILACGWGYGQTRYDFYQVTKVTKAMITLDPINKRYVRTGGHGDADVMPIANEFSGGKTLRRRFEYCTTTEWIECEGPRSTYALGQPLYEETRTSKFSYSCRIESYSTARLWDGTSCQESGDY